MKVLALVLITVSSLLGQSDAARVNLTPCEVPGAEPDKKDSVLCGKFEVFEDRVRKAGRKISINIVVYPATGPDKSADPVFYIPGGPGSSATEDA